jgi:hypothetical protein
MCNRATSTFEIIPDLVDVGVVLRCAVVEICCPVCDGAVNGVSHDLFLDTDCEFGTVGKREASLVFEACRDNAVIQFESVSEVIDIE